MKTRKNKGIRTREDKGQFICLMDSVSAKKHTSSVDDTLFSKRLNKKKGEKVNMSIASDLIRGHTDTIILARLISSDNYGYEINKSIQQRTNGKYELKEATLYTAFRRLEQSGCITSYWGDEQTGARRRYYSITDTGRDTYSTLITDWKAAKEMIDKLIETGEEDNGR